MEYLETMRMVLAVDDDTVFRNRLVKAIAARNIPCIGADGPREALELAREHTPSHIIVDLKMPEMSGLDLIRELRGLLPESKIIVLTGYGSIATAMSAVREGAVNYLTKPVDLDSILAAFTPENAELPRSAPIPSLSRVEWEHIQRILSDCDGNVSRAAKLLGIHRRSLQRKLQSPPGR